MVKATQIILFFILHAPLSFLLRGHIIGVNNFYNNNKSLIIAANHGSRLDPVLLALLPFKIIKKITPVYFPTAEKYHQNRVLGVILKLCGSYPIKQRAWTMNEFLGDSIKKLENGGAIMYFPEGQIIKSNKKPEARPGITYLASKSNSSVLPLHIKGIDSLTLLDMLFRRCQITLTFGSPIVIEVENSKNITSLRDKAQYIINMIYSNKIKEHPKSTDFSE